MPPFIHIPNSWFRFVYQFLPVDMTCTKFARKFHSAEKDGCKK